MSSKARELANLGNAYSDGALSNRNLIINGAMQVAQRGTTTSTHGSFSIDRFEAYGNKTSLVFSFAQDSDAPEGFNYCGKYTVTTAGTDANGADRLQYRIEGYDAAQLNLGTASAKTFTLSFYVKSSIAGDYSIAVQGLDADRYYVTEYTVNSADTWEYKTITVPGDTAVSALWDTTTGSGLVIRWPLGNNSTYEAATNDQWADGNLFISPGATEITTTLNATWQITGVQLEVGDTATPFEHRSYGQELALCQRYYYNTYDTPQSSGSGDGGLLSPCLNPNGNADRYSVAVIFPVQMRAKPTMVYYGGRGDTADTADRVAQYNGANLRSFTTEPDPTYKALRGWFDTGVSDNAISFHFTADAEI